MPFTDEPSGTLGSKDLLNNPDVLRALQRFVPGTPSLDRDVSELPLKGLGQRPTEVPWSYVFAIDGSNYETATDDQNPHQVGYVKVGGVLTPLRELFSLQQRASVGALDMEMLKRQRVTAAVVLPGQNVLTQGADDLAGSFRQILHEFMGAPQDALPRARPHPARSFYEVLAAVLGPHGPLQRARMERDRHPFDKPLQVHCPFCRKTLAMPSVLVQHEEAILHGRPPFEGPCSCGETLFLVDVLNFHTNILTTGSNRNILNDVMLTLERLMALHWVEAGLTASVLVLLDGPLALYGDRQALVPYMTAWLAQLNASVPEGTDAAFRPGLIGVSKQGQLVQHAQALHRKFPDLASDVYPITSAYAQEMLTLKTGKRPQAFEQRDRAGVGVSHLVKTAFDRWYVVDTPVWGLTAKHGTFYQNPHHLFGAQHAGQWGPLLTAINRFDGPRYGGSLLPMTFAHELVSIARDPSGVVLTQRFRDTLHARPGGGRPTPTVVVPAPDVAHEERLLQETWGRPAAGGKRPTPLSDGRT